MKKIISLFLAFVFAFGAPLPSYAGYAQLKVPPGWSPSRVPGSPATFKTGPAANDNTYKGSTVLTNAALEIGGQSVTVPVSMRLAANAATIGATYAFGNPALFATLAIGSAAYLYYQQKGLTVENGQWVKATDGSIWRGKIENGSFTNAEAACRGNPPPYDSGSQTRYEYVGFVDYGSTGECTFKGLNANNAFVGNRYVSVTKTPGTPGKVPVGDTEFHTTMDPVPVPAGVPQQLPDVDWPYEQPVINPNPSTIPSTYPSPATRPEPQPLWVPTGDPVKNPNPGTNPDGTPKPDTWTQPGKDIKPSGTPSDPWRVDVTDAPRTKNDPSPNTSPDVAPTKTPEPAPPADIVTCGLPGKPPCKIDETGTKTDKGTTFDPAKTAIEATETARKTAIDNAQQIQRPEWSFTFQLPSACTALNTGLRGVVLDVCRWREPIHDLMSMVWAAATTFCLIGMVGRTIRES